MLFKIIHVENDGGKKCTYLHTGIIILYASSPLEEASFELFKQFTIQSYVKESKGIAHIIIKILRIPYENGVEKACSKRPTIRTGTHLSPRFVELLYFH